MNCYLSWNLKDMTNISAEKLQKNISQQTSYIQLYRSELTKEAYKFNIGSLLRHVCTERASFGTEPIQRRATDCLIIFLHTAAFQKVTYFAPTDAENPAVAKCARNLHRLMLENVKSTMRFIDYEVLQKHARGEIDASELYQERERIHNDVFPDESLLPVSSNDAINAEFLKIVEMETRKARTFVDFDVQRNTALATELCQKLAKVPRSETALPDSRYGLIGSCKSFLETPFIRYGNSYYSFVTAYSLRTITETVTQFVQELPAAPEPEVEETEEVVEPEEIVEPVQVEEPTPEPEPQDIELDEEAEEIEPEQEETPEPEEAPEQEEESEEEEVSEIPEEEEPEFEEPEEIEETVNPAEEPEAEGTEEIEEVIEPEEVVEPVEVEEPAENAEPEESEIPEEEESEFEEPEDIEEAAEPAEETEEEDPFEEPVETYDEPEMSEASEEEEDDEEEPEVEESPVEEPVVEQMASDDDEDEEIEQPEDPFNENDEVEPPEEEENYTALVSPDAYDYLNESEPEEFEHDSILEEQEYDNWYDDEDEDEQTPPAEDDEPDPYSGESLFSFMDDSDESETVEQEPEEPQPEDNLIQKESFPADEEELPSELPAPPRPVEPEEESQEQEPEAEIEPEEEPIEEEPEQEEEVPPVEEDEEPEPEVPPVEEPVIEEPVIEKPAEQPLPLLEQILSFAPSKSNPIVQYLASCQYEQKKELVRFIELARKAWLIDGKDKVFSIPDTTISVAVFAQTQDPMLIIQRRENIGAVMFASQKDNWNSLEISYDGSGQLVKADYIRISRSTFSDWEWKVVEKLGTRLMERRGK